MQRGVCIFTLNHIFLAGNLLLLQHPQLPDDLLPSPGKYKHRIIIHCYHAVAAFPDFPDVPGIDNNRIIGTDENSVVQYAFDEAEAFTGKQVVPVL